MDADEITAPTPEDDTSSVPAAPLEVVTFGCRLNAYESEVIKSQAGAAENTLVFNTCAVTGEAVRQARQSIRKLRRERPDAKLVVTGCAAQVDPKMFADMPEVDAVVGNEEKLKTETWAAPTQAGVSDIMAVTRTERRLIDGFGERARAYVQVQNGCDHRCTFCVIPFGRGNSRSVPIDDAVAQVRRLVENGYREVVLTGVDITSWGADLPSAPQLGALVREILTAVPELARLRLSSLDAVEIDPELYAFVVDKPRVAPHLHLSLQSGDDMILKRMKRRHSRDDAIKLCASLKAARPEIAFGADIIAGFPTETEEMFANSLDLIDACALTFVHVFPFSPRPDTPAARMPQLDRALVKDRAARLRAKADAALAAHLERHVGTTGEALIERPDFGRLADYSPVRLANGAHAAGDLARVRILGHDGRELQGEVVT
ncbi:MAG: tRNA (N(6)-L-threonylcarbamoyladenosine(37)-C(2))-methylthiotransferase MtaB [Maricaulaceae bacterium]|jgi:threonylcarbamoyladenosine tRNA methylthiotransferase MtaB